MLKFISNLSITWEIMADNKWTNFETAKWRRGVKQKKWNVLSAALP